MSFKLNEFEAEGISFTETLKPGFYALTAMLDCKEHNLGDIFLIHAIRERDE